MPVVTIGDNTADDFTGCEDTGLWDSNPQSGGTESYVGSSGYYMTLIKFSGLSSISGPVTVNSATLSIYISYASGAFSCTVKRLLRNWVESEATNDVYSSGNNWNSTGGTGDGTDRSASDSGPMALTTSTGAYQTFTASGYNSDYEGFINGTYSNYGHHFDEQDSAVRGIVMSEGSDGNRPYITIDYTAGGGGGTSVPVFTYHYLNNIGSQ